jgi:hypothetical protein
MTVKHGGDTNARNKWLYRRYDTTGILQRTASTKKRKKEVEELKDRRRVLEVRVDVAGDAWRQASVRVYDGRVVR